MQIKLETGAVEKLSVDALAVVCFEADDNPPALLASQDGWLQETTSSSEFTGKLYETATLHRPQNLAAKRLVIIGGGKRATFSDCRSAARLAGTPGAKPEEQRCEDAWR